MSLVSAVVAVVETVVEDEEEAVLGVVEKEQEGEAAVAEITATHTANSMEVGMVDTTRATTLKKKIILQRMEVTLNLIKVPPCPTNQQNQKVMFNESVRRTPNQLFCYRHNRIV